MTERPLVGLVLTVDQRGSRHAPDRVGDLLAALADVPTLLSFERTAGDEVQAVVTDPAHVPALVERVLRPGLAGAVRQGDPVLAQRDDPGVAVQVTGLLHRPPVGPVAQLGLLPHRSRAHSSSVGSRRSPDSSIGMRSSRWRAMAAPTSPLKSGCGRVGRERSSGWAWVAM